jgi:hypothetical protein
MRPTCRTDIIKPTLFQLNISLLFWDDLTQRLLKLPEVQRAASLWKMSATDLSRWHRSPSVSYLQVSPSIAAVHAEQSEQYLYTFDIDIPAREAAYFLVKMRIMGASLPFARLWWNGEGENINWPPRIAFLTTIPDGFWHTYAIPLHSHPAWAATGRIRQLRFDPVLSKGWIEIESLEIISRPP